MPTERAEPLKLLLLEDNKGNANSLAGQLKNASREYRLVQPEGLDAALEIAGKHDIHLCLLDLSFSGSDHERRIDAIRTLSERISVIALTEPGNEADLHQVLKAGAEDYLSKDRLSADLLERTILHTIERSRMRRQAEADKAMLAQSRALLGKIFGINSDAILILSDKYEITFFNPAAASLLDASEDQLIGETFPFEVGPGKSTELEIPDSNGSTRLIELTSDEIFWEGKRSQLIVLHDVTELKEAKLALKREKELLSVALDTLDAAVITTDKEGRIERINQEACHLTGVEKDAAVGQLLGHVLRLTNPATGKRLEADCKELLDPAFVYQHNRTGLLLDSPGGKGSPLVSAEMHCIVDDEEQIHSCVTILRDIKKQRMAEEELYKNENLNSISLVTGGIAHDFNNILTSILGNISIARMRMDESDENSQQLRAAEKAALQAKSLTRQLLTFAKGGAPVREVTTIGDLVEECVHFIMRGSNVHCEIHRAPDLWPVDVDSGQIAQVINNLLINADQAMPDGGTIDVTLENIELRKGDTTGLNPGEYIKIEVKDSGTGIPADKLSRIFDPYFTTKEDGNGLGLASSYSIIKRHDGTMSVESEPGKGSCFSVFLPRSLKEADEEDPANEETPKTADIETHDAPNHASKRILIMDDMEDMKLVAGEILKMLGYEVECTSDGKEAIEAYKQAKEAGNPFDAVVFDLTVPGGMGGEEAGNILIEYDPGLRAIASSGYSASNVMSDHSESAFIAVVPKPYRINDMKEALERVLS